MKSLLISIFLIAIFNSINSQIKIATNNSVGIAEDAPVSKLSVNYPGHEKTAVYFKSDYTSSYSRALSTYNNSSAGTYGFSILASTVISPSAASYLHGIKASAYSTTYIGSRRAIGVFGLAGNATSGYNYGVYGQILGSGNGSAIFASTPGYYDYNIPGVYAGYFRGKVRIEGDFEYYTMTCLSDEAVKKDIRLYKKESISHLERLKSLHAIKYKLKTPVELNQIGPEITDTLSIDKIAVQFNDEKYSKDYIGLSAQDVQKMYPDLVKTGDDGFLRMNYIGLIPILIEAINEQQEIMNELKAEIDILKGKSINR